jgi:acetoin utilization protein AcuC
VPRSWTHLLATVLDRDVEPGTALPAEWTDLARRLAPTAELPTTMSDGRPNDTDIAVGQWDPTSTERVDAAIRDTRHAVFPLHGLDPDDPRD